MKPALIILSIIVIIGVLNASVGLFVKHNSEKLLPYIENVKAALKAGDIGEAKKQVAGLKQEWDKRQRLWEAFIDHRESEHVETILEHLHGMLDANTPETMLPELEELSFFFEHLTDKQKMLVENIF